MRRRFRRLFRHPPNRADQLARELDDEIQSHLAARAEQLQQLGLSPEEARTEALRRFGDVDAARSRLTRTARGRASRMRARERAEELRAMIAGLRQDVRVGLRALRAHPTFSLATVATLGLAVAAAVTAFTFADAIFLRPLPAPAASRLVRVYLPRRDGRLAQIGQAGAALLRDRREIFDRVAVERCCTVRFVRERGALDQRFVALASAEFFPLLGVRPALGRFFLPEETATEGRDAVAVLSYALWQRTFRGDPRVVGEHITIGTRDFAIIGVAPADFAGAGIGAAPAQMWVPPTMASAIDMGCIPVIPCQEFDVLARLSPGVSVVRAEAGLANLGAALSRVSIGDDSIRPPQVRHATGALVAAQRAYSPLARLLGAIATLLLLIACANLSGLLIVRGASRAREMALRRSLGAHRLRIVQQLLVESSILGVTGGALGLALSVWTTSRLMAFFITNSEGFETYFNAGIDGRILWFTLGTSLLATLLFGVLPALLTTRAQPADVLKAGGPGGGGLRPRLELIALQVALTSALLCGAVLLSASFNRLLHAQRFEAEHVALFRVRPAAAQYEPDRAQRYVRAVAERVAALPEVESVAFARGIGFAWSGSPVDVGVGVAAGDSARRAEGHFVSPDFFRTLRIAVTGREFTTRDAANAPLVAMVSAALARTLWPSSDIIGRTLYARGKAFRVLGVVPDYRVRMRDEPAPLMAFFAFSQNALGNEQDARFVVRVHGDPARLLPALRTTAESVDRGVPVVEVMTLAHQIDANYPQIRLGQTVLVATGCLALLLSAIGLYGMIAFLVARRTRDIGLRIALGALPARIAGRFVVGGMTAVVAGLVAGMSAAWLLGHLLSAWLVGVAPHEVSAFAIATLAVLATAVVACAIPASRAARIDPAVALRAE